MNELWKPLIGFDPNFIDRYEISSKGNIRSLSFIDSYGRLRKGRVLKQQVNRTGYCVVRPSYNDCKTNVSIHRAVALAFINNPDEKENVNHIDGVKTNNDVSNLEWATASENSIHAVTTGLSVYKLGSGSRAFKAPTEVYNLKGEYLYSLCGNAALEEKGFDYRLVSDVVLGKRKSHKQHIFKRRIK